MPLADTPDSRQRYRVLNIELRLAIFLVAITFILCVALEVQIQQRNHIISDLQTETTKINIAATSAQKAAEETNKTLNAVLAQVNTPEAQEQTRKARERLANMEYAICSGPCPAAPSQ